MTSIIEKVRKYKGFKYMVLALEMGHRCGYVEIPRGHKLYRKSDSDRIRMPKAFNIKKEKVGKRSPIDILCASVRMSEKMIEVGMLFNVHGGITFSGRFADKRKEFKGWWLGFDCAHAGDAKDLTIMSDKFIEIEREFGLDSGTLRTKEYVEKECKALIRQIIKYFNNTN